MGTVIDVSAELVKKLSDEGRIIEAGWVAMRWFLSSQLPEDRKFTETELEYMRDIYFAGSQHMWSCLNNMWDDAEAPTERDKRRIDNISEEMNRWYAAVEERRT
jgi:hypothetical protein